MSVNYDKDRAEKFTERILANPNSSQLGVIANDLLREYHRGYPVENLRSLLANRDECIVITGAWIASELGAKGTPLLADISRLIGHPQKKVRFSVIDCLLVWAGPSNQAELASVIGLLSDPEAGVRWKVMDFLSRATPEQLVGEAEERRESYNLAHRLLDTLKPDDRMVMVLKESEDLSVSEIAETLGWSEAKVKIRAFRARQALRKQAERMLAMGRNR